MKKRDSRQFVVINEEKLINEVQQIPILYDKALKGYRKPTVRDHAWQEVANSVQSTVEESKKRWRSLRDAFMKQYKQNQSEDPRSSKRKKWLFYDQMEFLVPFLEINYSYLNNVKDDDYEDESDHKKTEEFIYKMEYLDCPDEKSTSTTIYRSNSKEQIVELDENEHIGHEIEVNEEIIDVYGKTDVITEILREPTDTDNHSDHSSTATTNTTTTAKIPNILQNTNNNIEMDHNLSTESIVTSSNNVTDSDERFLLSCAQSLRRLSPKQNGLARLKIQQILYEIEFGNL